MNFGQKLKEFRTAKEMSLRTLAIKLDITPTYLSDIENNRRKAPGKEIIDNIAIILSLSETKLNELYNMAGKERETVPLDLPDYINQNENAIIALRKAKKGHLSDDDWKKIISHMDHYEKK